MVFIGGPRQVGKTTFAGEIGKKVFKGEYEYLNWDNIRDRKLILSGNIEAGSKYVVYDELHKYKNWKNYIKGVYDKNKDRVKIAVTGSSRLDIYRKGGDSLLGRYHYYRMHPFSMAELQTVRYSGEPLRSHPKPQKLINTAKIFSRLMKYGGFPEIYLKEDASGLRRWHNERSDRVIKEDIRDIESIKDISSMQVLVELLKDGISSDLSVEYLSENLQVSFKTVQNWLNILERFYYIFRIYPFQSSRIRALKKKSKLYLWDWSEAGEEEKKLENIVASHLLKFTDYLYDAFGYKASLHYIKDKDQREIDFLVALDNKPWFAVEVKTSYKEMPASLKYFTEKLNIPVSYLVVQTPGVNFINKSGIRVVSADIFLTGLV
ncbi:MAG: hypothetical protein A2231_08705 [Candidatus Firestonebacteria bacterium RIFOXYA2_FULL_40_8]|nr:MAG: hypothetical protein A2231_08705 [Candidatus Firestonebacteria bacterium RIFOXYA2_FULL_40_8]